MQRKRAKTSTSLAFAREAASATTVSTWDMSIVSERQAAAMLTFASMGSVSVSADAARVGEPKEDVLFASAWSHQVGAATWMAPQVVQLCKPRPCEPSRSRGWSLSVDFQLVPLKINGLVR